MEPIVFADRYVLLDRLGEGGTGEVFRALDRHRGMEVALKLLTHPQARPDHAYVEATVLTSLRSDNIVEVFDANTWNDIPFIATAIADGGSTDSKLADAPFGLPPDVVLRRLRHALIGLQTCHTRGVLHRDVKPSNVFLANQDWAMIGDFGLAHLIGPDGAPATGTTLTRAPETLTTDRMDVRADLYSLGVTGYVLLTGKWPFEDADEEATRAAIVAGSGDPLRDLSPHVSDLLARRISTAMALDPARRYQDAAAMLTALTGGGLVKDVWQRTAPEPGHVQCFRELARRSGQRRTVCVLDNGTTGFDVLVRFAISGQRVPGVEQRLVPERLLGRRLTALFRDLAR